MEREEASHLPAPTDCPQNLITIAIRKASGWHCNLLTGFIPVGKNQFLQKRAEKRCSQYKQLGMEGQASAGQQASSVFRGSCSAWGG